MPPGPAVGRRLDLDPLDLSPLFALLEDGVHARLGAGPAGRPGLRHEAALVSQLAGVGLEKGLGVRGM